MSLPSRRGDLTKAGCVFTTCMEEPEEVRRERWVTMWVLGMELRPSQSS